MIGTGNYTALAKTGVCTPICPLKTTYRSRYPVNYTLNSSCPQYKYFNTIAEVNAWEGKNACCCTLWCATTKAVDFDSPGVFDFSYFFVFL